MCKWLHIILEVDYKDTSLLERIHDLRNAQSFPEDRLFSHASVREFLTSLAPSEDEKNNVPRNDKMVSAIADWVYSLCILLPEQFRLSDLSMSLLFGFAPKS